MVSSISSRSDVVPLKVVKLDDGVWVLDVDSNEIVRHYFPRCRSKYELFSDVPACIRDKVILLAHAPTDGVTPVRYEGVGHRSAQNIFWIYLTKEETYTLTHVSM